MNYTITFSPSIDYVVDNKNNLFNSKNLTRVENYFFFPGGKGINASYIMNQLGVENKAIFYSYGRTTDFYLNLLKDFKINNFEKIDIKNNIDIRINLKYFDPKNKFEINGPSPKISKSEFDKLKKSLSKINDKDIVFVMGKCDESILIELIEYIKSKKAEFVIDIDSNILLSVLKYQPLAIKPNIDELELILNKKIKSQSEIIHEMHELKNKGAKNVIISMGHKGSLLLDNDNIVFKSQFEPLKEVKSTVGCGDTLLSSFVSCKYNKKMSSKDSFEFATAMSMSTASQWFLANKKEAKSMIEFIQISKLN